MENAEDRSTSNELNNNLRELIDELRGQKQELTSLREEVRGKSLAVETEVKRIKSGQDIKWRYEGNKVQFEFNSYLEDNLKQTISGLENGKSEYSIELLKELCEKLRVRNKSDHASHAANSTTSDARVHTLKRQSSLTTPAKSEIGPVRSKDTDIEDEYFSSCEQFHDGNRFTDDFYEYEQGQKDIIVKGRLRQNIDG